jgi:23S rRNA pseudouridine2604 synthase
MSDAQSGDAVRLAKRVADLVPCSRADAERYIAGGWVSVDGAVTEDPATRVMPGQAVTLLPGATADDPAPVTILLHKPAGLDLAAALALIAPETLVTMQGRGQPQRFLRRHLHKLAPVMPLELDASGLLVLTQDWRVARRLVDDADRVEQEYVAEVLGAIAEDGLQRLNGSVRFNGKPTTPVKVSWQSEARLRLAGKGMRAGQVAVMCAAVGLSVKSLRRLRIGKVALGPLPAGQWRYLSDVEKF